VIVADCIADALARRSVRHVFGVGGANIEDLFAAVQRRRPELRAILSKHEHAAACAADAYARLTGGLGVVMATSGGGAMNLLHALAEARASRVPVLALVGEPPSDVQGKGAFQDTSGRAGALDAAPLFQAVSVFCARLEAAGDVARLMAAALAAALGPVPGPAVLLIAKDRQRAEVPGTHAGTLEHVEYAGSAALDEPAIRRAARMLDAGPVVVIAGDEIVRSRAGAALADLVRALDARIAVTPDARDAFDNRDPRFLGVAGAMGHPAVASALAEAGVCLVIGSRLPVLARQGLEEALRDRPMLHFGREPAYGFLSSANALHVGGDLGANLRALLAEVRPRTPRAAPATPPPPPAAPEPDHLTSQAALAALTRALPEPCVLLVDAGNTGAQAVHHLCVPRGGQWLLAMGMAGMGWSFGAAVGAALATGRRCVVLAGDGAFFMHGLDVHTAVEHRLPITYVIFNNRAHGMCLVRERLLLREESGYNTFGPCHIGVGLAAMFPGLPTWDCRTLRAPPSDRRHASCFFIAIWTKKLPSKRASCSTSSVRASLATG
jgi:acetolactate synthase I/II/III large subunit